MLDAWVSLIAVLPGYQCRCSCILNDLPLSVPSSVDSVKVVLRDLSSRSLDHSLQSFSDCLSPARARAHPAPSPFVSSRPVEVSRSRWGRGPREHM
jgi:hypothetical protein